MHSFFYSRDIYPLTIYLLLGSPVYRFSRYASCQGICASSTGCPSVGSPQSVPPRLLATSVWLQEQLLAASARSGRLAQWRDPMSYFRPPRGPPGGPPALLVPAPPGCCSPGRTRCPVHPRLSQRHRIRLSLPRGVGPRTQLR